MGSSLPKRQRVAAYAVILRDDMILLSRLSPHITTDELWTLPGGGLDHGEDPRHAVLREVKEETGLDAMVGDTARVYSAHLPGVWREGRRVDAHALRIVYDGWVAVDAPEPRVLEVDGSTVEAAWQSIDDVMDGTVPVAPMVLEALADHRPFRMQRIAAYALIRRDDSVLLTRISDRGAHPGSWTLPGGGIDHGESPRLAVVREVQEECGVECTVGDLIAVHDDHFDGTAPTGRHEDFHGVHLIFAAACRTMRSRPSPRSMARPTPWRGSSVADIESGRLPTLDVVRHALAAAP